jgi:hypothetical protein
MGMTLSALLGGAYVTWTADQSEHWTTATCAYLLVHPRRAAPGAPLTFRVVRTCGAADDGSPVELVQGGATFVRFGDGEGDSVHALRAKTLDWRSQSIPVRFEDVGVREFVVDVRGPIDHPVQIRIARDVLGGLSTLAKSALALASGAPALIGLLLAFHGRMRSALGALLGESARTDSRSGRS